MKQLTALLIILFSFYSTFSNAQNERDRTKRSEKIKALKIAFITDKLNLTENEAEKFWPIYNTYDEKIYKLERLERYKLISKIKNNKDLETLSNADAKGILTKIMTLENNVHALKKEFTQKLIGTISYKKILILKSAEKEFIRQLMKRYRKKNIDNKRK